MKKKAFLHVILIKQHCFEQRIFWYLYEFER